MGAWRGQPGLLTDCFDAQGLNTGLQNLIDPSNVISLFKKYKVFVTGDKL